MDTMASVGIQRRGDFDRPFLENASFLKIGYKMSLADTFGMALSRRLNAPLVTTNHHELDAIDQVGVALMLFIR